MNTFYATTEQAESIEGQTKNCQCDCGQSYAIIVDEATEVVICDACFDNAPNFKKYI